MRVVIAASAALLSLLGNWPSAAADLRTPMLLTKAKPRVALTYQGCGSVLGLGTFMEADKSTVSGNQGVAFSGYVAGGALAASAGYLCGDGLTWKAVEVIVHYNNVGGGSPANAPVQGGVDTKVGLTGRAMLGGPVVEALRSLIPSGNLSTQLPVLETLPVGVAGSHPYVFAAVHFDQVGADYMLADSKVWRVRGGTGFGVQSQFTPTTPGATAVTMDVWVEYLFAGSGLTLGNTGGAVAGGANIGSGARTGVLFKY